ncbi:MAG: phosphatidate cytidylyltransferase [Oscillospiraceae bacterium]|nr:phosphatidate cytidylyltransferase [Oscillospiraceae bacterium]
MKTRVIVALLLTPLLFVVLYFTPPWVLPLTISAVSMLAVHELLGVTNFVLKLRIMMYSLVFTGMIPVFDYFDLPSELNLLCVFLFIILLFIEGLADPENVTFEIVGGTFIASYMIPTFFCSVMHVFQTDNGKFAVLFVFIIPIMTDIFAMFTGMLFGKRKLLPSISPKKTVEGSIGGIAGSMVFCVAYGFVLRYIFSFYVDFVLIAALSLAGSVIGQIGDLSLSFIKRRFNVKDFGAIIPGHGGVLDRFDSLLFVAPLVEITLRTFDVVWT